MFGIIISGHGNFATGLLSAYRLLSGECDNIIAVDFLPEESEKQLQDHLEAAAEKLQSCQKIVFLTDILGGSPFKNAVLFSSKTNACPVIYGVNLAMLIECGMAATEGICTAEPLPDGFEERLIDIGREMIGIFELQ